jgi:cyclopropane-fatty-acyl-phospholipid synthase
MPVAAQSIYGGFSANIARRLLDGLVPINEKLHFNFRLWDGTVWGAGQPRFTVILKGPAALRPLLLCPNELSLGEAYIYGDIDIEGDIEAACELGESSSAPKPAATLEKAAIRFLSSLAVGDRARVSRPLDKSGPAHSKSRDRQVIRYHYDLPVPFYALWLDERMVYSCAYFARPEDDIDTAQLRKLDYICRKLRLRRGDYVLDIGCGWGGLVIHAATHYGAKVLGITLSVPQAEFARQRIHEAGLDQQCRVEVCDYRDLEPSRRFDKIVSVGMFEHVGKALLPEYFNIAFQMLRPGGVFLNHGIACSATYRREGPSFSDRYVFPDGELVPISTTLQAAEEAGFEVRDVESMREHYVLTARCWVQRLEASAAEAIRLTDDTTYRIWRLYMAGAARRFQAGRFNLFQTLFVKSLDGKSRLPLTRQGWYDDDFRFRDGGSLFEPDISVVSCTSARAP